MMIPGVLTYYENIVSENLNDRLLDWYSVFDLTPVVAIGRYVKHFGYKYDYKARRSAAATDSIPLLLRELMTLIPEIQSLI